MWVGLISKLRATNCPLPRECPCCVAHSSTNALLPVLSALQWRLSSLLVFGRGFSALHTKTPTQFPIGIGVSRFPRVLRLLVCCRCLQAPSRSRPPRVLLSRYFLARSSRSLTRSLLREHADSSFIDKFFSTPPEGPLSVGRSAFGSCCSIFSLSSSGCTQFQLAVLLCIRSGTSSIRSNRARSRSSRRTKGLLVSLRPRGTVGDGNVEWSPGIATFNHSEARSTGFQLGLRHHFVSTGSLFLSLPLFVVFQVGLGRVFLQLANGIAYQGALGQYYCSYTFLAGGAGRVLWGRVHSAMTPSDREVLEEAPVWYFSLASLVDALWPTAGVPLQIDSIMPRGHHRTKDSRMLSTVMSHQAFAHLPEC